MLPLSLILFAGKWAIGNSALLPSSFFATFPDRIVRTALATEAGVTTVANTDPTVSFGPVLGRVAEAPAAPIKAVPRVAAAPVRAPARVPATLGRALALASSRRQI